MKFNQIAVMLYLDSEDSGKDDIFVHQFPRRDGVGRHGYF